MAVEIFGGELRVGDIVSLLGFFGGGITGALMLGRNVDKVVVRMGFLEKTVETQSKEIAQVAKLVETMGRYEERFSWVLRQLDELRRGRGFIVDEQPPSPHGSHRT